jgi:chloramphenicol 3-O phosphotransferase
MASIIIVHGASSSGKSSLARALQARLDRPFFHYSIDHLRDSGVLPMARIRAGDFQWRAMRQNFFDGFHRSIAAFAAAGNDLILEHIIDDAAWRRQLIDLLSPFDLFFVGVHCSLKELRRRESERGDRPLGSAESDFHAIHKGVRYDFEVDAEQPLAGNVEQVIAAWQTRRAPSAFLDFAGVPADIL